MTKYNVKAIKTFRGSEDSGWECSLYNDQNKKVAVVVELGGGGEVKFYWADLKLPRIKTNGFGWKDEPMTYNDTPAQSALRTHCLTLPKWLCAGRMVYTSMDVFVTNMVNDALTAKDVKKMLRKIAVYDDGEIYTYKVPPSHPTIREQIKKKSPNAIVLNDLPIEKVIAIWHMPSHQKARDFMDAHHKPGWKLLSLDEWLFEYGDHLTEGERKDGYELLDQWHV